jgi:hypothetical protein
VKVRLICRGTGGRTVEEMPFWGRLGHRFASLLRLAGVELVARSWEPSGIGYGPWKDFAKVFQAADFEPGTFVNVCCEMPGPAARGWTAGVPNVAIAALENEAQATLLPLHLYERFDRVLAPSMKQVDALAGAGLAAEIFVPTYGTPAALELIGILTGVQVEWTPREAPDESQEEDAFGAAMEEYWRRQDPSAQGVFDRWFAEEERKRKAGGR